MWEISTERSRARFLARFSRFLVIWEVKNLRNLAGIWLACASASDAPFRPKIVVLRQIDFLCAVLIFDPLFGYAASFDS